MRAVLCALLLISQAALALDGVTFGPEFTVFNFTPGGVPWILVRDRMIKHLVHGQPEAAKFIHKHTPGPNGFERDQLISPNGWWLTVAPDRGGVVEVQTVPASVNYFKRFESDMQDAIFASASNEEFFPAMFTGGGHINVGIQALVENPLLLRNFIVDLLNHNELFMGVFGYDTHNAIPLDLLPAKCQDEVRNVIARFDRGVYRDVYRFLDAIQDGYRMQEDDFKTHWKMTFPRKKFFAVNLTHALNGPDGRIELRSFRPQASMNMFIRQIDLFQRRINYLEAIKKPIPLAPRVPVPPIDPKRDHLDPPISAQLALQSFYTYVRESGARWKDHRDYLWPNWITGGELEKFEASEWFKEQEKQASCEVALAA